MVELPITTVCQLYLRWNRCGSRGPVPVCVEVVPPVGAAAGRPPVGTRREQPVQQFQHVLDVADARFIRPPPRRFSLVLPAWIAPPARIDSLSLGGDGETAQRLLGHGVTVPAG
jgi:hypothetical protein